jgi:hypothetical protein
MQEGEDNRKKLL